MINLLCVWVNWGSVFAGQLVLSHQCFSLSSIPFLWVFDSQRCGSGYSGIPYDFTGSWIRLASGKIKSDNLSIITVYTVQYSRIQDKNEKLDPDS